MTIAADPVSTRHQARTSLIALIDKWIFVFMASVFVVTVLVGFVPDSLHKVGLVASGERAPFPPVLHVHAVLMGSWLMLLLTQTILMATGNAAYHKQLGLISVVLAPAMVASGAMLVPAIYAQVAAAVAAAPPEALDKARAALVNRNNVALLQLRSGLLFTLFAILALRARRIDSSFHKRMMVIATLAPIPAAFNRMTWLPNSLPASPLSGDIYMLVLLLPMFVWDCYRLGRIHRAYVVFLSAWLPVSIAAYLLWGTAWWQTTFPRMLGYG